MCKSHNLHIRTNILILTCEECNDGKYGEVCGEECGFCADLSYCNHVNGTCLSGCDAGYNGNLCRHGNQNTKILHIILNKIL